MDIKSRLNEIDGGKYTNNKNYDFNIPDEKLDKLTYDDFEQELLTHFWNKYHGNINRIADKLKLSNRTLYRKFKQYGLKNGKSAQ